MDHYKVLEIRPEASQTEIKAAYKRLAKMYHPDINKSDRAHALFQYISESYQILSDPARRAAYDRSLQVGYQGHNQYPPYENRQRPAAAHRRNPASYRSAPPLRQADLVRPYMKYAYGVAWIGFALAMLLFIDFAAPSLHSEETLAQSYVLPGARSGQDHGRSQLIYTNEGTRMEVQSGEKTVILTEGRISVEKTYIFHFPKKITLDDGITMEPVILLHSNLSFFPILLFVFSSLASFFRQEVVFDFNVCLVTGVFLVITMVMIVMTT